MGFKLGIGEISMVDLSAWSGFSTLNSGFSTPKFTPGCLFFLEVPGTISVESMKYKINLVQDVKNRLTLHLLDHWTGVGNILTIAFHVSPWKKPRDMFFFSCFFFSPGSNFNKSNEPHEMPTHHEIPLNPINWH